ncbi:hypothetical protein MSAN_01406800 [Mycena sanguinolenta]|uniref:TFIIS N-terminal domain-containing protein n=1 Tax=Mycena sanguinolenta TaxID=230812 RepID=A0A8H6YB92_9AGAR|nr:hypothetical protein MSAN_01406800 [Mycena sanguinolenta]
MRCMTVKKGSKTRMDSSTIHSWQSPYHPVHASTPAQDWQKQASPRGAQTEVATQIARSPALDLSDFTPSNPPASPLSAQSSSFYPLNGATTSSAASATQQQPSESLQMVIDPALTTMNGSTSNERRQQMLTAIRPLLQANAFTGPSAVATLAIRLLNYGSLDVDAATRMEILTKIRDGAGNHYFCTWAENPTAVDITREWLKAAFAASHEDGGDAQLVETIMPLLHLIDRLPMTVESLKASKLGKVVVKLVKDPPTPAIKDMASNIERRWRQMVVDEVPNSVADDPKSKKRKIADPPVRALPPRKKTAVGAVPAKEPAASSKTAAPVKDAKSDSSFFSAPKLKPKLPSFKKAPPAPAKKDDVAQPSAIDPFQEALKTRKGSPLAAIVSTPSPERSGSTSARGSHLLSPVLTEMESVHPASYIPRHIVNCGLNLARKMEDQTLESLVEERVAQLQAISQRRNALLRQMFHMVQNRQNLASVIKLQDEEGDEELAVFLDKFDLTKNPDTGSIDYFVQDHLVVSTPSLGQASTESNI